MLNWMGGGAKRTRILNETVSTERAAFRSSAYATALQSGQSGRAAVGRSLTEEAQRLAAETLGDYADTPDPRRSKAKKCPTGGVTLSAMAPAGAVNIPAAPVPFQHVKPRTLPGSSRVSVDVASLLFDTDSASAGASTAAVTAPVVPLELTAVRGITTQRQATHVSLVRRADAVESSRAMVVELLSSPNAFHPLSRKRGSGHVTTSGPDPLRLRVKSPSPTVLSSAVNSRDSNGGVKEAIFKR